MKNQAESTRTDVLRALQMAILRNAERNGRMCYSGTRLPQVRRIRTRWIIGSLILKDGVWELSIIPSGRSTP